MSIYRGVTIGVLNIEHATVTTGLHADAHHLAVGNREERMTLDAFGFQIDTRMKVVGAHLGKTCRIERFEIERIAVSSRIALSPNARSG